MQISTLRQNESALTASVALSSHFDDFIQAQVKSGRYNNASEVVRARTRSEIEVTKRASQAEVQEWLWERVFVVNGIQITSGRFDPNRY